MLKNAQKDFIQRHIGPSEKEQKKMLQELGYDSLDELIKKTVPEKILFKESLDIGDQIKVRDTLVTVVGIFATGGDVHESEIWADLSGAQGFFRRENSASIAIAQIILIFGALYNYVFDPLSQLQYAADTVRVSTLGLGVNHLASTLALNVPVLI